MNASTPGLPVHHQLPEFTHSHIHRVDDAIQPSHPLSSPSPPAPNPSQHQIRVFSNESILRMRWPKYWNFSFSIIPSKEIPGLGRSPGEGKGYPLQYSSLENSMGFILYGVAKSRTRLSDFHCQFFHNQNNHP